MSDYDHDDDIMDDCEDDEEIERKKKKTKMLAKDVTFERVKDIKKVTIPEGMSYRELAKWAKRKEAEDEKEVRVDEVIAGYPSDAALALTRAMADIYGWTNLVPTPGFWGSRNPPVMISVRTGVGEDETIQIPWGRMEIPNVEGYLECGIAVQDKRPMFRLDGVVKNKNLEEVRQLAAKAREFLREQSIYRGKAVTIEFPEDLDDYNIRDCPKFIDTTGVDMTGLIFHSQLQRAVKANIFNKIRRRDRCNSNKVDFKRGILLEGPYGCGKTMIAYATAKVCEENDWTFLLLSKTADLAQAIRFAEQYQPCVIFAEDIDQVMSGEKRSYEVNEILNTIDGVATKDKEIMVILTTNHRDKINSAMLRHGRIHASIPIEPPDAEATEKIIRYYGRENLLPDTSLEKSVKALTGLSPALIRNVVDTAKLYAIDDGEDTDHLTLTDDHIHDAATQEKDNDRKMRPKKEDTRSNSEKAAQIVADSIVSVAAMQHKEHSKDNGDNHKPVDVSDVTPALDKPGLDSLG